jgi:hypothetical protein
MHGAATKPTVPVATRSPPLRFFQLQFPSLKFTEGPSVTMAYAGLLVKALGLGVIVVITQYVLAYLRSPLKNIPGPLLAKFSNIWRFLNHYGQTHIETQRKLHEQYGDVVRLGPTTVSVADTSLIKTIYNTRGTFLKSDYYVSPVQTFLSAHH